MAKRLYTEADVRALERGSELVLGPDALATPAALDLAFERRIKIVHVARGAASATGVSAGGCAGQCGGNCGGNCVWGQILRQDGSYVVEVKGGRAQVWKLTPNGPQPVGTDRLEGKQA